MKILVPTDGSGPSRLAMREAAELAQALRASVTVLAVSSVIHLEALAAFARQEFSQAQLSHDLVYETPSEAEVQAYLREADALFRAAGVEPVLLHRHGDPAAVILEVAQSLEADLIVVGAHGRTGIRRFLLGSVSEKLARHAACSVLIARGESLRI